MNIVSYIKALSDEIRIRILHLLLKGELCVCKIVQVINIPQSSLSHHLSILKKNGIIQTRKSGKWNYYSISENISSKYKIILNQIFEISKDDKIIKSDEIHKNQLKNLCH